MLHIPKFMKRISLRNSKGFSIISMLVALAILGIITVIFMTFTSIQLTHLKKLKERGEVEDLKNLVRVSFSCDKTVNNLGVGSECPEDFINLYGKSGTSAFIKSTSPWTEIGGFEMRAKCEGSTIKNFQVYYMKSDEPNSLFSVPLSCSG